MTDDLRRLAETATPGKWVVHDMSDKPDSWHWWWVWREEALPYYGGILNTRHDLSKQTLDELQYAAHSIGVAEITDGDNSEREYADAAFIAAANPATVLALLDERDDFARSASEAIKLYGEARRENAAFRERIAELQQEIAEQEERHFANVSEHSDKAYALGRRVSIVQIAAERDRLQVRIDKALALAEKWDGAATPEPRTETTQMSELAKAEYELEIAKEKMLALWADASTPVKFLFLFVMPDAAIRCWWWSR